MVNCVGDARIVNEGLDRGMRIMDGGVRLEGPWF